MIPEFLLSPPVDTIQYQSVKGRRVHIIERTLKSFASFIRIVLEQNVTSTSKGWLQRVDARVKLIFLFLLTLVISLEHSVLHHILVAGMLLFLASISYLPIFNMYKRIGAISFVFGFLMFVPVVLNLFSKGYVVLPLFSFEHSFFVGHLFVPKTIGITAEGLKSLSVLSLRVCNSVSLCMLVFYTTPFSAIVKSLRLFRVPVVFLFTINMTFKFVFILAQAIEETYMALKMRLVSKMKTNDTTTIVVGRILYTFQKSWQRYELVFQSMLARGFTGNIVALKSGSLTVADWLFLLASFALAAFLLISH